MQEPKYKWEIAIAGLIHDIGKLYQKSNSNVVAGMKIRKKSADHPLMVSDFIDKHYKIFSNVADLDIEFIRQCAQRHHSGTWGSDDIKVSSAPAQYKKYCQIINIADNLSSSERTIDEEHANKELATLVPFFTRLKENCTPRQFAFKLTKYSDNKFRIISVTDEKHDAKLVDNFISGFEADIDTISATSKQELFRQLMLVVRDYTWCLPAAVRESIRDVSLYQHLITTSAIATAIYSDLVACSENEQFTFVNVKKKEENIKLIHIKLVKSESYIIKSKELGFNILDDINKKKVWLSEEYSDIIDDIINKAELTKANNVISSEFESYLLVGDQSVESIINIISEKSNTLKSMLGADVCISYSIQDLRFNPVESNGKTFKHMAPVLSNAPEYMTNGLEHILKNGDNWNLDSFLIKKRIPIKYESTKISKNFAEFKHSIKELGNKIAFICIDGDKTIETMEKCFQSVDLNDGTISRISTYTNILKTFFEEYLKDNFPDEYIININTNKLIIASSIENIIGKVANIKKMFCDYTMNTMTLSITVHVYNINEKLVDIVDKCNISINNIKKKGGNRVIYKGLYLATSDLEKYIDISEMVYNSCDNVNALRRLATYSSMYKKYIATKDVLNLMCHPLYTKNRSSDTKKLEPELTKIIDTAFSMVFKGEKGISKELYLLENIIDDTLIERRIN